MEHKLTNENFAHYKHCCKAWIEKLGLKGWSMCYVFSDETEEPALKRNKAIIEMNRGGMVATTFLNKKWEAIKPTQVEIEVCAFHEMLELLIHPLIVLSNARFNVDELDIEYEKHRIIRTLENTIFTER